MLTVSPDVAAARAYLIVRNGVEACLPLFAPPNNAAAVSYTHLTLPTILRV